MKTIFRNILNLSVIGCFCFSVFGCSLATGLAIDQIPQTNELVVVSESGKPVKDKKVYFNLQCQKLTPVAQSKWRKNYIPNAFSEVGLKNYEILTPQQNTLDPTQVTNSYLMVLTVPKWTVNEDKSCTDLWVPATLAIFELPEKKEIMRLSGEASDCKSYGWSIGKMVSSLLVDMLNKAYVTNG